MAIEQEIIEMAEGFLRRAGHEFEDAKNDCEHVCYAEAANREEDANAIHNPFITEGKGE